MPAPTASRRASASSRCSALDRQGNVARAVSNAEMGYAYGGTPRAPRGLIFTSALFEGFPRGQATTIKAAMDAVQHHRETVQPIREKTGGSTFKNPEGTRPGSEIDKAGCRGLMIGGAQMSPMHCNFMINTGNATGYDLEYLGETVRARVLENSGIRLHWEIKRIGHFKPGHEVQEFLGQGCSRFPARASRDSIGREYATITVILQAPVIAPSYDLNSARFPGPSSLWSTEVGTVMKSQRIHNRLLPRESSSDLFWA